MQLEELGMRVVEGVGDGVRSGDVMQGGGRHEMNGRLLRMNV